MQISVEKVLVSNIAENNQQSISDTRAIPQKRNHRDTRCDTEKTSKKYRRYQVLRYFIAILTALQIHNTIIILSSSEGGLNSIANFDGGPWPDLPPWIHYCGAWLELLPLWI